MQNIELITLPTRKDDRGWVITPPVIKNFGSAHLHIPSLKPKAIRGNHYHETHSEAVIILGGKCLVATRNIFTDTCEEFVYDGIIKQLLLIPPNITHAFKNIDYHSIYLVCYSYSDGNSYSDNDNDNDNDIYKADVSISSTADRILT